MTKNMGNLDRTLRIAAAVVIAVLYLTNIISGTAAIVLGVIAAVFVLTSLIGFCPAYPLLGINTCGKNDRSEATS
ncbi:MAG: DUF2892 domain-containing protein [Gammaproteobacteria bacterium]